jgi:flagellin
MSLSIQTNVSSILAQENLRVNTEFQSQTIQRVTSGYRINSSADDAAGLAVANKYRTDTAELTQGVRNANDGISTLQIVDGGLSNISKMLDRLKTLATESASQTFTGDRDTLNTEYQTLLTEINRQADNIGLGKTNNKYANSIDVYTGGGSDSTNAKVTVDLTGSKVDSTSLNLAGTSINGSGLVSMGTTAATVVGTGNTETFTVNTASGSHTITINGAAGDTVESQMENLNGQLAGLGITASLDTNSHLQLSSSNAFSASVTNSVAAEGLSTNAATGATQNTARYSSSVVVAAGTTNSTISFTYGSKTTTLTLASGSTASNIAQSINAQLATAGITGMTAVADANTANTIDFQGIGTFSFGTTHTGDVISASPAAATAPTATGGDAANAIAQLDAAVQALGTVQGKVGTGQNQLQYAINLAQSQIASFSAAESRIRDTDIAAEASNLTKAQVLQQSSLAALAQANQAPQALLALLKG